MQRAAPFRWQAHAPHSTHAAAAINECRTHNPSHPLAPPSPQVLFGAPPPADQVLCCHPPAPAAAGACGALHRPRWGGARPGCGTGACLPASPRGARLAPVAAAAPSALHTQPCTYDGVWCLLPFSPAAASCSAAGHAAGDPHRHHCAAAAPGRVQAGGAHAAAAGGCCAGWWALPSSATFISGGCSSASASRVRQPPAWLPGHAPAGQKLSWACCLPTCCASAGLPQVQRCRSRGAGGAAGAAVAHAPPLQLCGSGGCRPARPAAAQLAGRRQRRHPARVRHRQRRVQLTAAVSQRTRSVCWPSFVLS